MMEKLPAEILYHIFDNLDAETIFFSVRPVSRLFRSIVQTYNRYNFDFQSISRPNFGVLLHFIPTQHIQSLTLYNTKTIFDQYETFFSLIRLRQLTCLQSIKLVGISEMQFNYLCKRLNLNSLKSFTLDIEHCDNRRRKTTYSNLSKIFSQPTIRQIDLDVHRYQIIEFECPLEYSVEVLTIRSNFTFEMLSKLFSCSPRLHKLIIKDEFTNFLTPTQTPVASFRQLQSLVIEGMSSKPTGLQNFLLLTPSLRYLKFETTNLFDSQEWEGFIQVNLPCLTQFKFYCAPVYNSMKEDEFKVLVDSFQTPFWLEHKKWFVTGKFCPSKCLFTIPSIREDPMTNNSLKSLSVTINSKTTKDDIQKRLTSSVNITSLSINFSQNAFTDAIQSFENSVILSNLIEIKLTNYYPNKYNTNSLFIVFTYLSNCRQLSKLTIDQQYRVRQIHSYLDRICALLPTQIKELYIPVRDLQQVKIIAERCTQLQKLFLDTYRKDLRKEIRNWFEETTIGSVYRRKHQYEMIWLGKKVNQINTNYKRFKTTDEE